ncbi:hypothetical protein Nepgr_005636 [Nepenthes gracilis]|uniref:Uncharacterized protein n=1 Tax=Nepenthes gracilis TaxID=150966 RepID=A0AAD3S3Z9_NEPGR|nr:hypothetical protein Nepgr_005636 [Nepenthes gracilis]
MKQMTDPVVYKLVRVDFDGKLIPATDDELMEVEDLLEYEKSKMLSDCDAVQTVGCSSNGDHLSEKPILQGYGGLMQSEKEEVAVVKLNAGIECIEMLQKVNKEERHRFTHESPIHLSSCTDIDDQISDRCDKLPNADVTLRSRSPLQETLSMSTPSSNGKQDNQIVHSSECPNSGEKGIENRSSVSAMVADSKPNFSRLKGEINLDKLTIRELQETFRATFGRATSVKDKQWLKRRIVMGLTNSCDVSVTSFIIKDKKLVQTDKEDSCKKVDAEDLVAEAVSDCRNGSSASCGDQMEDAEVGGNLRSSFMEYDCKDDSMLELKTAKRVRKPTRRYIEELSDMEAKDYCEKLIPPAKQSAQGKTSTILVSRAGTQPNAVVTRHDSLGGSNIQVPYISRVRRCRPRKSIMSLTRFQSSGMGMTTKWASNTIGWTDSQLNKSSMDKTVEVRPVPFAELLIEEGTKEKQSSVTHIPEVCGDKEPKRVDLPGNYSDDTTVPTAKGGIRRKHHRAWTLSEVVKLVEGVSRFGAGRWSEIKRLSFASYSYRTSVDLKDKWRNLLKASCAYTPSEKGTNPRKNATIPIPAPILSKVRELAEMNSQSTKNLKASGSQSGASVSENRSGFL